MPTEACTRASRRSLPPIGPGVSDAAEWSYSSLSVPSCWTSAFGGIGCSAPCSPRPYRAPATFLPNRALGSGASTHRTNMTHGSPVRVKNVAEQWSPAFVANLRHTREEGPSRQPPSVTRRFRRHSSGPCTRRAREGPSRTRRGERNHQSNGCQQRQLERSIVLGQVVGRVQRAAGCRKRGRMVPGPSALAVIGGRGGRTRRASWSGAEAGRVVSSTETLRRRRRADRRDPPTSARLDAVGRV